MLWRIPACSKYLQEGGASRTVQREPPTAYNPPVLPLSMSTAYEWPEYNKLHFFSLPPSCKPVFTSLRISGNVMYVYVCDECECLCISELKRKSAKKKSNLVTVVYIMVCMCAYSLYIMLWVYIYVCTDFLPLNMRCVYPMWNRKADPWGPDHAWTANPESELFGVWNTRSSPWEISSRSLTLTMKDMLSPSLFLSL